MELIVNAGHAHNLIFRGELTYTRLYFPVILYEPHPFLSHPKCLSVAVAFLRALRLCSTSTVDRRIPALPLWLMHTKSPRSAFQLFLIRRISSEQPSQVPKNILSYCVPHASYRNTCTGLEPQLTTNAHSLIFRVDTRIRRPWTFPPSFGSPEALPRSRCIQLPYTLAYVHINPTRATTHTHGVLSQ